MHVGLNATCFDGRPSGARQRFEGIYGAVIRDNPAIRFTIFEPATVRVAQWFPFPNVMAVCTPIKAGGTLKRVMTELRYWRSALAEAGLDVFETFNLPLVEAAPCPTILTVHDIRYVRPGVSLPKRIINSAVTRRALSRADRIVTVSDTIRDEIKTFRPETQVTTIYNGVDPASFGGEEAACQATLRRFGMPRPYALAVGHLEPRKNYPVLLQAFMRLRDQGSALRLVIVGKDGGSKADVERAIVEYKLEDRVTILEEIDDADLRALYAECELVVFPSLYEGFGIPVLEAMAARKPLVLSDIAVFRELTEEQGCYFPPTESAILADRIHQVVDDTALQQRLIEYGDRRLGSFSFDSLAAQVVALYHRVIRAAPMDRPPVLE